MIRGLIKKANCHILVSLRLESVTAPHPRSGKWLMRVVKDHWRDFPSGPAVSTPHFHCRGHGFDSGWETNILQAMRHSTHTRPQTKNHSFKMSKPLVKKEACLSTCGTKHNLASW